MANLKTSDYINSETSVFIAHLCICFFICLLGFVIGQYFLLILASWLLYVIYRVAKL